MNVLRFTALCAGLLSSIPLLAVERISVSVGQTQANGNSYLVSNSADGRYVAFGSDASNLVAGDTNGVRDVFLRDRSLGTIERISTDSNELQSPYLSRAPSVSADGRYVSFETMGPLLSGSSAGVFQIYRRDRSNGETHLVSGSSSGVAGNAHSSRSSISADGRYVLFYSRANNLVSGDSNGVHDVFLKDMQTGTLEVISTNSSGIPGNGDSFEAAMSSDARFVAFTSMATNLIDSSITRQRHVYLRDRQNGTTRLVSKTSSGVLANQPAFSPALSDDGRYIVYYSKASNLAAGVSGSTIQILLYDATSGNNVLLSKNANGTEGNDLSYSPSISADGNLIAFTSFANNLVHGDNNAVSDVILMDRLTNEVRVITQAESGQSGNGSAIGTPVLSRTANSIVFSTYASNLLPGDTNNVADIFVASLSSNSIPVARAGSDQRLQCSGLQTPVTLDGRASDDADGDSLKYVWSLSNGQIDGAVVTTSLELGIHTATLSVDDLQGGVDSDVVAIEITDNTPPSLLLADEKVLEAESRAGSAYQISPVGTDLCSGVGLSIRPAMDIYPLGETIVTASASDSSGNTTEASQIIRVADTTAPVLNVPADIRREADARQMVVAIGTASATDIFDVVIEHDAPAAYSVGTTSINWQATDSNGNRSDAIQQVIVEDTTAPVFSVVNDVSREASAVRTPIVLAEPTVNDIFQLTLRNNAPSDYALGNTLVTWYAEDEHGNSSQAQQTVSIVDTTAPKIVAPADLLIEASGELTSVQLGLPVTADIFPVSVENDAAAALALGQHTVTWTAKDSSGNRSQATQLITVQDTTAPSLVVVSEIVVEAQGTLTPVVLPEVKSSDAFAVTVTNNAPLMFPLGSTVVIWQAVDTNGNETQALQLVRVVDTTAPSANIEQLRDSIWPPNNKLIKVARITGLKDLVDMQPQLDAVVEWDVVSSSEHHNRPERRKLERNVIEHGKHERRGGAHSSHAGDANTLQHTQRHRRASSRDKKSNWKLVKQGEESYLYVRASMDGRRHNRIYSITISLTDKSGNQSQQSMQVLIEHQHQHNQKRKHQG
ncbi:MAG: PKD domain-containing protein [Gammaproteobacteria bacterium]|nr:PKD domain-containing protein [Gammaproteobacteria bacterium]